MLTTLQKRALDCAYRARARAQAVYLPHAHKIKRVEHWVHYVGYLGGVVCGAGYRWAAAVMLAVFVIERLLHVPDEEKSHDD